MQSPVSCYSLTKNSSRLGYVLFLFLLLLCLDGNYSLWPNINHEELVTYFLRIPIYRIHAGVTIHSKNTRVSRDLEKGPLGPNSIPGQRWPGNQSNRLNNGVRLTQFWVIFRVKLTDFRVIVDPEWSLAPMDPFPGHADPGVFRVYFTPQKVYNRFMLIQYSGSEFKIMFKGYGNIFSSKLHSKNQTE